MRKFMRLYCTGALMLALPALAQNPVASSALSNGLHPDDHGPDITVRSRPRHRLANGLHPEDHGPDLAAHPKKTRAKKAKWKMTVGHVRSCKRRYKTYNRKTNRYVARPGVLRRCVL